MPQASTFKVQVLNALSIYFYEQSSKTPEKQQKPMFTHYVIFRGTKIDIFNKWEIVAKHIQCPNPIYKDFIDFQKAIESARKHFRVSGFYIEPEEVQTFADMAKTKPGQVIKNQEELITNLQDQLVQQGKNTHSIQEKVENSLLKQKISILETKYRQVLQKASKKKETTTVLNRSYDSFKARIIDIPWWKCLQPITDKFPEFKTLVSQKVCAEFPIILYELQKQLEDMTFTQDAKRQGFRMFERTDQEGRGNGLRLILIYSPKKLTDDQIIQFYHNGMIDYKEIKTDVRTTNLLNKMGEKIVIIA
ncbi:hypothetical protein HanIR_Chr13g0657291 [Helianthus annuus]|nr:hypothetical protein HanIR_Chr13g0657291 [Helianthus annuus]